MWWLKIYKHLNTAHLQTNHYVHNWNHSHWLFSCKSFSINRVCPYNATKRVLLIHNGISQKVHVNITALSFPIYHRENPSFTTYLVQLFNRSFYSLWLPTSRLMQPIENLGFSLHPSKSFCATHFLFVLSTGDRQQLTSGSLTQNQTKPHHFILPRPSSSHFPHIWFQCRHLPANITKGKWTELNRKCGLGLLGDRVI